MVLFFFSNENHSLFYYVNREVLNQQYRPSHWNMTMPLKCDPCQNHKMLYVTKIGDDEKVA
jgi:hypothetical protein